MKIKVTNTTYSEIKNLSAPKHTKPQTQKKLIRHLMRILSEPELRAINFEYTEHGMDNLAPNTPAMYLMNHSSFTDLQIAAKLLVNRQYHIVTTNDGFIGKYKMMQILGCIPTRKFITDPTLVKDMKYCVDKLKSSILMFPEASYTFDGTTTPLPDSIGKCIKLLGIPVVMIKTHGAFLRDPLYNNLQKRKVNVTADVTYLISPEDIVSMTADEISKKINDIFIYDHFDEQIKTNVLINESFRADGLERVLYKCNYCETEGNMKGSGTTISCSCCGCTHSLESNGQLKIINKPNTNDSTSYISFNTIPEWYKWERQCVLSEIKEDTYTMDIDVDICVLKDYKSIYKVGTGHLSHTATGWHLIGCDGEIDFSLPSSQSYNLYADYYWYEIGDMISIGNLQMQYYCFPKDNENLLVAKARLATEELYKIARQTKSI